MTNKPKHFWSLRSKNMWILHLCQVVDSRFHFCQLTLLKVKQLEEVSGQTVDLVGYTGQRVCGVVLGFLQSSTLVCSLKTKEKSGSHYQASMHSLKSGHKEQKDVKLWFLCFIRHWKKTQTCNGFCVSWYSKSEWQFTLLFIKGVKCLIIEYLHRAGLACAYYAVAIPTDT